MPPKRLQRVLFSVLLLLLWNDSLGSSRDSVTIVFNDTSGITPVSFVHLNSGTQHWITDIEGRVTVPYSVGMEIRYKRHPYYPGTAIIADTDTFQVMVQGTSYIPILRFSDVDSKNLIEKVVANRKNNDPESDLDFQYDTYNKFTLSTNQVQHMKGLLGKALNIFKIGLFEFDRDHHILLSESVSQRKYAAPLFEEEVIRGSKISGVDRPKMVNVNSQFQSLSLYKRFIRIGNSTFTNPINIGTEHRYHFRIVDTIPQGDYNVFIVQFSPKASARFESIKGFYWIEDRRYAITKAHLEPAIHRGIDMTTLQTSKKTPQGWFPERYYTQMGVSDVSDRKLSFTATTKTVIHGLRYDTTFDKRQFDDIAIKYKRAAGTEQDTFWVNQRKLPFDSTDKNTYKFYDTVGYVKNFEKVLNFGEHLYFKEAYFKDFILEMKHLAAINEHEGLRLGFGGRTSPNLFGRLEMGGYGAYGFKDKEFKYGAGLKITGSYSRQIIAHVFAFKDVREAAGHFYHFDKPQFSSEWERKLKIRYMDQIEEFGGDLELNHYKYTKLRFGLSQRRVTPQYIYSYTPSVAQQFRIFEAHAGIRYAYGERNFKLRFKKFPFESKYPIAYLDLFQGIQGFAGGLLRYTKVLGKVEWKYRFLSLGTSYFQLSGGIADGELPYFNLFNGKGSRGIRAVAHNSFETMDYIEFASDRYLYFFYSHDFGFLNFIRQKNFRPRVEVAFNAGIGSLKNPEYHQGFPIKTMERGYLESGFMITDLLVVRPHGIKAGFGIGYFYRFGPNALPTFAENSIIKLATNFVL